MNIVSLDNISRARGSRTLFHEISFGIDEGDKVGVIGVNGCGKSTLLRMIAGQEEVDSGRITWRKNLRIAFLAQDVEAEPDQTVRDYLFALGGERLELIRDYESACEELERLRSGSSREDSNRLNVSRTDAESIEAAEHKLDELTARLNQTNAWNFEGEVRSLLRELGIDRLDQPIEELSGGRRKKVALARALIDDVDLLILDEPTNHLDVETIVWLEEKLERMSAAILMVTHDRYFLESIVDRIVEIEDETVYRYPGSYSVYLEKKAEREALQQRTRQRAANLLKKELVWLQRQPKARGTKQKARIDRADQLAERAGTGKEVEEGFAFKARMQRLGKRVLEVRNLSKSFGAGPLFGGFEHAFKQGERIGLVGPNGAGKTTFLEIITGRLAPDTGDVNTGINTRFGYFDQHAEEFQSEERVIDFIRKRAGDVIELEDGKQDAVRVLEYFYFDGRLQYTAVNRLSGGERRRLQLVYVLMSNPNFLILDEPTNDLDVRTLGTLEEFLQSYPGCLVVVSHDRYFMDRVVDQLLVFDGHGHISGFNGAFSSYIKEKRAGKANAIGVANAIGATSQSYNADDSKHPVRKKRFSFKEKREFAQLEERIAELERERDELTALLSGGETDASILADSGTRFEQVERELKQKYARWEELAHSVETTD